MEITRKTREHIEALYIETCPEQGVVAYQDLYPGDVIVIYFDIDAPLQISCNKDLPSQSEYAATVFYEPDVKFRKLNIVVPGLFKGRVSVPPLPIERIIFKRLA